MAVCGQTVSTCTALLYTYTSPVSRDRVVKHRDEDMAAQQVVWLAASVLEYCSPVPLKR